MSWIILSVMAAAFQTLRFTLQKRLSMGALSAGGATLARFAFTAPFVTLLAAGYLLWRGQGLPEIEPRFWALCAHGWRDADLGDMVRCCDFCEP